MTRREPTASGDSRRGRSRSHAGAHDRRKGRHARRSRRKTTRHATHATHARRAEAESRALGERPAAGGVWRATASAGARVAPLLTLDPAPSASESARLTLAGAEHGALRDALHAWGDARDEAVNRAWRRPGGLMRMAGL